MIIPVDYLDLVNIGCSNFSFVCVTAMQSLCLLMIWLTLQGTPRCHCIVSSMAFCFERLCWYCLFCSGHDDYPNDARHGCGGWTAHRPRRGQCVPLGQPDCHWLGFGIAGVALFFLFCGKWWL